MYNETMSPRHFSSKGGPYFIGQTFRHDVGPAKPKRSLLARIKQFLKNL